MKMFDISRFLTLLAGYSQLVQHIYQWYQTIVKLRFMKILDISQFLTLQAGYSQLFQPDCNRHELRGQVICSIFSSNQIHHHKCQIQIQIHGTCNALKTILTNHMILKKKIEKNCPVWIWRKPVIISWQWSLLDKGYVPLLFWITNLGNGDHDFLLLFRPFDHFLDPVSHVLLWFLD